MRKPEDTENISQWAAMFNLPSVNQEVASAGEFTPVDMRTGSDFSAAGENMEKFGEAMRALKDKKKQERSARRWSTKLPELAKEEKIAVPISAGPFTGLRRPEIKATDDYTEAPTIQSSMQKNVDSTFTNKGKKPASF